MNRLKNELTVRPLFYEALSGEFPIWTGEVTRFHTLGRLAVATFTKGSYYQEHGREWRFAYSYLPSWAPDVMATIGGGKYGDDQTMLLEYMQLENMLLRPGPESSLDIFNTVVNDSQHVDVSSPESYKIYELELGDKLHIARNAVTQSAQLFFS